MSMTNELRAAAVLHSLRTQIAESARVALKELGVRAPLAEHSYTPEAPVPRFAVSLRLHGIKAQSGRHVNWSESIAIPPYGTLSVARRQAEDRLQEHFASAPSEKVMVKHIAILDQLGEAIATADVERIGAMDVVLWVDVLHPGTVQAAARSMLVAASQWRHKSEQLKQLRSDERSILEAQIATERFNHRAQVILNSAYVVQ